MIICFYCLDYFETHEELEQHYDEVEHDENFNIKCGQCSEYLSPEDEFLSFASGSSFFVNKGFLELVFLELPQKDEAYERYTKEEVRRVFGQCIHRNCLTKYIDHTFESASNMKDGEDIVVIG